MSIIKYFATLFKPKESTALKVAYYNFTEEDSTKPWVVFARTSDDPAYDIIDTTSESLEFEIKIDIKGNVYFKVNNKWILQSHIKHVEISILE